MIHSRFVYTVRYIPNRIQDSVKFRKRNFKSCARTVHVLSNMKNVAFSRCCFVTLYKQRQRNEQRIITHACTAMVLVAVVVVVCLSSLIKHTSGLCSYGVVKTGCPWTRSMRRGSWTYMDSVQGPDPRSRSMDQGSMFCTLPI